MILNKFNSPRKKNAGGGVAGSSGASPGSPAEQLSLYRMLWGVRDTGQDIDGPMTVPKINLSYPNVLGDPQDLAALIQGLADRLKAVEDAPPGLPGDGSTLDPVVDNICWWLGVNPYERPDGWYGGTSLYALLDNILAFIGKEDYGKTMPKDGESLKSWIELLTAWVGLISSDPGDWEGTTLYDTVKKALWIKGLEDKTSELSVGYDLSETYVPVYNTDSDTTFRFYVGDLLDRAHINMMEYLDNGTFVTGLPYYEADTQDWGSAYVAAWNEDNEKMERFNLGAIESKIYHMVDDRTGVIAVKDFDELYKRVSANVPGYLAPRPLRINGQDIGTVRVVQRGKQIIAMVETFYFIHLNQGPYDLNRDTILRTYCRDLTDPQCQWAEIQGVDLRDAQLRV